MNYYLTKDNNYIYKIYKAEEPPKAIGEGNFAAGDHVLLDEGEQFENIFPAEYHLKPGQIAKLDLCKVGFELIARPVKTAGQTYLYWHKRSGIKEGDEVRIMRKAESYEGGWRRGWNVDKDPAVGETFTVISDGGNAGFQLHEDGWHYPYFVLEKI